MNFSVNVFLIVNSNNKVSRKYPETLNPFIQKATQRSNMMGIEVVYKWELWYMKSQ